MWIKSVMTIKRKTNQLERLRNGQVYFFFALDCFTNFLLHSRFDQNQNHTRGSFSFKTREAVNPFKSGPLIEKSELLGIRAGASLAWALRLNRFKGSKPKKLYSFEAQGSH